MTRRAVAQVLAALMLAIAAMTIAAPSASAVDLPTGTDCLHPPVPTSPDGDVAGWIDPGPAKPIGGDPFSGKPDAPSIYDVYGYGGLQVVAYDDGCASFNPLNMLTNVVQGGSAMLLALSVRLYRTITDPGFGAIFDPIQRAAQNVLGNGLFLPLIGLTILLAGAYFVSRSSNTSVAYTANKTGKLVLIVGLGVAAALYPLTIGAQVDRGLGQVVATSSSLAVKSDPRHTPADALAGAVHSAVLYNTWAQATFGSGEVNARVAKEYGPRLFKASTFSRGEQAQINADPTKARELTDKKQQDYKDAAKEIQDKYPQVYEYVAGNRSDVQLGYVFVGMLGALIALGFLVYALFKLAYAMVIVRVAIAVAPALALIAAFPTQQHRASAAFTVVADAVMKGAYFGAGAILFTVAGVGGIMSPDTQLHPLAKLIAMLVMTYVLWKGAKHFGLASDRAKARSVAREARDPGIQPTPEADQPTTAQERFTPGPTAPSSGGAAGPSYAMRAEHVMRTKHAVTAGVAASRTAALGAAKGAKAGAAKTVAAAALTGGTAGAVAIAAGAAKGASKGAIGGTVKQGVKQGAGAVTREVASRPAARRTVAASQKVIYHPSSKATGPAPGPKAAVAAKKGVYRIYTPTGDRR